MKSSISSSSLPLVSHPLDDEEERQEGAHRVEAVRRAEATANPRGLESTLNTCPIALTAPLMTALS